MSSSQSESAQGGSGSWETASGSSGAYKSAVSQLAESVGMMPLPPPRSPPDFTPVRPDMTATSGCSGGGAPLYSPKSKEAAKPRDVKSAKPEETPKGASKGASKGTSKGKEVVRGHAPVPVEHKETAKGTVPSPADEEARLLNASSSFADQVGPLAGQPALPPSIRPTTYRYGGGVAFPSQPRHSQPRQAHPRQALVHVGGSRSSYTSGAPTSYSSQVLEDDDGDLNPVRAVTTRIAMASLFISRTAGLPIGVIQQHERMMNDISQTAVAAVGHVCRERDDARREVQHLVRQAMHNEQAAKTERDQLNHELNRMIGREDSLKKDLSRYRDRANKSTLELEGLERDTRRFQEHHQQMASEWEQRDRQHFERIQTLEGEVTLLRRRLAERATNAGEEPEDAAVSTSEYSSPSVEASQEEESEPASPPKKRPDSHKVLLNLLNERYGIIGANYKSKAPAVASSSKQLPPSTAGSSTKGNPSNWPALISRQDNRTGLERYASRGGQSSTVIHTGPSTEQPKLMNTSIARDKDNWEVGDIIGAIDHLEQLTKGYVVSCHSTDEEDPPKVQSSMLPLQERATWDFLLHLITGELIHGSQAHNHMMYLLSVPAFRPYIIMRVALDYLHKKIISPQLFLGLDESLDSHLRALQTRISTFTHMGTFGGGRDRQLVVNDHARIIRHAFKDADMALRVAQFRETSINYHSQVLSEVLKPLRAKSVQDDAAFQYLRIMVAGTWDISAKVWMSGMTLHFLFPDCGSKFGEDGMRAVNSEQFGATPGELQFVQTRVCFAISPSLTVRDERDESNMICQRIRKSDDFLGEILELQCP
ncbi:hypothetical protein F5Y05DRAFT_411767 [Hypoxylon sp. FL0543]|nr:hypothetical protein F5Y05DRAFT_411767 [Hypoxylon sp. FL0543]